MDKNSSLGSLILCLLLGCLLSYVTDQQLGVTGALTVWLLFGTLLSLGYRGWVLCAPSAATVMMTAALFALHGRLQLDFLVLYAATGIWCAIFLSGYCWLARGLTFTDNHTWPRWDPDRLALTVLTSVFLLFEAVMAGYRLLSGNTLTRVEMLTEALLFLATFMLVRWLLDISHSTRYKAWLRNLIKKIGLAGTIAVVCVLAAASPLACQSLPAEVPEPTLQALSTFPAWAWLFAALPGLSLALLVVWENRPRPRDFLLASALTVGACSLAGLPWALVDSRQERGGSAPVFSLLLGGALLWWLPLGVLPWVVVLACLAAYALCSIEQSLLVRGLLLHLFDLDSQAVGRLNPGVLKLRTAPFSVACVGVTWLVFESALAVVFPLLLAGLLVFQSRLTESSGGIH